MMIEPRTDDVVEVVRARRFELVGYRGRVLAALEARADRQGEGGSLTLYDAEGSASVFLTGHADTGEVSLSDGENITASLSGKDGVHIAWVQVDGRGARPPGGDLSRAPRQTPGAPLAPHRAGAFSRRVLGS
jgi:hypothetical protein